MTAEISNKQRLDALQPAPAGRPHAGRRKPLILGVVLFGGLAATGGLVLAGFDLADTDSNAHVAVYAVACFILAGLSGGLVCINALLADRQEFYRRGQLDGWMKGWRGQEPNGDDPLFRQ